MTSDPTSAAATVDSGTPATVVASTGLKIEEFVFRQPPHPLPTGSETSKRTKYSEAAEWGATEAFDRRLRERVVVTFKAVNTNNDVKYKLYLVKNEDESDVTVTFDTTNTETKFTFYEDDEFHTMSTPEGQHYWRMWTRKYKDLQKLDLIDAGKYKAKMVTKDKDDNEKTWFSSNTIEVKYDPFKVLIVTSPMTDTEIENEKVDGHLIHKDNGMRVFKDSILKVYRGAHTSSSADAVLVGTYKGMTMPTYTGAGGNIATPRGTYFGFKDLHGGSYDCLELEDTKRASGEGVIMLPVGIDNNPVSAAPNYPSGKNYKDHVQIHKNPNTNQTWISTGLSHGCIVVPKNIYGSVSDVFKNRQNTSATTPEDNSSSLLGAIFGSYETKAIPKKSDHKRKLDIKVMLGAATGTTYAAYRAVYTDIIQEVLIEPDGDDFKISFRVPRGIYRDFKTAQRHFNVSGNTKYKWYIAKKESDGKVTALRTIVGGSGFTNLTAGKHDWKWDGYDKGEGVAGRKREAGTYYCVMETKFNPGLTGTDAIDEKKVLDDDAKMGTAWNYPITIA